jgi:inner membrane protein
MTMTRGLLLKLLVIAGLAAALSLPLVMVGEKVLERESLQRQVRHDIAASTAEAQRITGPLVAFACREYVWEWVVPQGGKKEDPVRERKLRSCPSLLVLPERLQVSGTVQTEVRRRGIYAARVYRGELRLAGELRIPAPPASTGPDERRYSDPALVLAITDPRGLKGMPALRWLGEARALEPGVGSSRLGNGLHLPLGATATPGVAAFEVKLALAGTERLEIAPIARQTEVHLASSWPHPSFFGRYLPDLREVGTSGFNATWRTTHFATGAPEDWRRTLAASGRDHGNVLGVAFIEPVNFYSLAYRAAEYGFLFVALTFGMFFFAETLKGIRIHPVQYGMVGLALAVFFLLLIALAEHVGFATAYIAAAAACIVLLTFYARHVFGSPRAAALYSGWNVALYGLLYVVLQSEDHALLLGSIVVFAALAAAMIVTRRVDWYALSDRLATPKARRGAERPAGAPASGA